MDGSLCLASLLWPSTIGVQRQSRFCRAATSPTLVRTIWDRQATCRSKSTSRRPGDTQSVKTSWRFRVEIVRNLSSSHSAPCVCAGGETVLYHTVRATDYIRAAQHGPWRRLTSRTLISTSQGLSPAVPQRSRGVRRHGTQIDPRCLASSACSGLLILRSGLWAEEPENETRRHGELKAN